MSREVYVLRDGQLVPKSEAPPLPSRGPYVISDGMDAIRNHADGRVYDSKSQYYRAVKAAGCEIVGNDTSALNRKPQFTPTVTAREIRDTYERMRNQ